MAIDDLAKLEMDKEWAEGQLVRTENEIKRAKSELFLGFFMPVYFGYVSIPADLFGLYLLAKGTKDLIYAKMSKRINESDLRKINLKLGYRGNDGIISI